MIKRVEINLGQGNLTSGFDVAIELKDGASRQSLIAKLEPAPQLIQCYQKWKDFNKQKYELLLSQHGNNQPIEICQPDINVSADPTSLQFQELKDAINDWLYISRDFCAREKQLCTALGQEEKIMVIISTQNDLAWRLPWHLWSFFDHYRNAGVVLSHPEFRNVNSNNNDFYHPKVLAIVDNRQNRNDLEYWAKIKKIDLDTLSGDEFPEEFSHEEVKQKIAEKLDEQSWNILFFGGHSSSDINNGIPRIFIKPGVSVTIYELENTLSKAIKQGLQLAIFNSCDGLGVARDLLKINLPKVVVMREDVPNKVAEEFLKYFLEEFMADKGTPAFLAVQRASLSLRLLERRFPGASLLPVICSNPATEPLIISPEPEPLVIPTQSET